MKSPKVSVSLITYNHEKYIAACLDSIVSQEVNFEFEIVVSDDCSKDRTAEIVADYAAKYPNLIRAIFRNPNLGSRRNAMATVEECKGQYIALMEGDDFWVDNHKLQVEADYLDANPDCAFCYTNQYTFFEDIPGDQKVFFTEENMPPEKIDVDYFIKTNQVIPNNTKMFRREVQPKVFPEYFFESYSWDWMLQILHAGDSKMGYINRVTLAYRRHPGAVYIAQRGISALSNGIKSTIALNKFTNYKYDYRFKNLWWEYHEISFAYLANKNFLDFVTCYWKYLFSARPPMKVRDELWRFKTALLGKTGK
jgi:glycosyltransferase involved in cell wall biosynthesis